MGVCLPVSLKLTKDWPSFRKGQTCLVYKFNNIHRHEYLSCYPAFFQFQMKVVHVCRQQKMPRNNPSRPSSANSTVGKNSKSGKNKMPDWGVKPTRGPKPHEAACISEDVKIGIDLAVERFRKNETQKGQLIGFCTVSQLISVCS